MVFSLFTLGDVFVRSVYQRITNMSIIIKIIIILTILLTLPAVIVSIFIVSLLFAILYSFEIGLNKKELYKNGKTLIIAFSRSDGTNFLTVKGYRKYYNITDADIKKTLTVKQINKALKNNKMATYYYLEYIVATKGLEMS